MEVCPRKNLLLEPINPVIALSLKSCKSLRIFLGLQHWLDPFLKRNWAACRWSGLVKHRHQIISLTPALSLKPASSISKLSTELARSAEKRPPKSIALRWIHLGLVWEWVTNGPTKRPLLHLPPTFFSRNTVLDYLFDVVGWKYWIHPLFMCEIPIFAGQIPTLVGKTGLHNEVSVCRYNGIPKWWQSVGIWGMPFSTKHQWQWAASKPSWLMGFQWVDYSISICSIHYED